MTTQELLGAVMNLEREIESTPRGAPELAAVIARIRELQAEVGRQREVQGPLVPDAASPKSPEERTTDELGNALDSLMSAAQSKQ
jgi:hypothetical protein